MTTPDFLTFSNLTFNNIPFISQVFKPILRENIIS